ncbi:hypothetical protein N7G274_002105 [Stereocaulon virgatum]|uniref:Microbial-type PARG catalytic domain-containing protein n=1 Tax=Stereocaulon virgatum TaxID=373712 RepID=A0ABR4AKF9_9LECA
MPQAKAKPSEIASEAKKTYTPYILAQYPQFPPVSISYPDSSKLRLSSRAGSANKLRVAVIEGDPVDVALGWHDSNLEENGATRDMRRQAAAIPVVNMANEKRAGGDWESGLIAPEECLCRRSNLAKVLTTPSAQSGQVPHYPIRTTGGIYSPHVVVFRSGPDKGYTVWKTWRALPVISVAPIRRPKLDESGVDYSFSQERELMKEKMRTVLRIAVTRQHSDLCMGAFGVGFGFRNPAFQVASMWRELLFSDKEFQGAFGNIVFALESTTNTASKGGMTDLEVFKKEFDPSNTHRTTYR